MGEDLGHRQPNNIPKTLEMHTVTHCRLYAICPHAQTPSCSFCREMVEAMAARKARWTIAALKNQEDTMDDADPAYAGDIDPHSGRRRSPLDLAWLRRGAGLKPVSSATVALQHAPQEVAETSGVPHLMPRPGSPLPNGTQTFTEFCELEIARINARLAHIAADSETALAQKNEHSANGNTGLALHCDARVKMLALEEGLLKRALERWERVKSEGHFGQRY